MLRSLKQLYGNRLGASDGEIGHVKDFYFDDRSWAVRYLVADTGTWLPSRQVLIAPHAFGRMSKAGRPLEVKLTRHQIENSPSIETHKPVSRQYEEEYYRYFGWPYYWQGEALWGLNGEPILEPADGSIPRAPVIDPIMEPSTQPERPDAHLRSAQAVTGYHVQASDGIAGHVCDFLMNARNWAIELLVVKTGHRFSGQEVLVPVSVVEQISYEESSVAVHLTKEAVEKSFQHNRIPEGAPA